MSAPTDAPHPVTTRRDGFGPAPDVVAVREGQGIVRVPTPFGPNAWLLTRYDDVRRMLGDADGFANGWTPSDLGQTGRDPRQLSGDRAGNLLALDPPDHTRLRRLLTGEFTVRGCAASSRASPRSSTDHLDAMERAGAPADLVSTFALPMPSLVICELLGVPPADQDEFQAPHRAPARHDAAGGAARDAGRGGAAPTCRAWSPAPAETRARTCSAC